MLGLMEKLAIVANSDDLNDGIIALTEWVTKAATTTEVRSIRNIIFIPAFVSYPKRLVSKYVVPVPFPIIHRLRDCALSQNRQRCKLSFADVSYYPPIPRSRTPVNSSISPDPSSTTSASLLPNLSLHADQTRIANRIQQLTSELQQLSLEQKQVETKLETAESKLTTLEGSLSEEAKQLDNLLSSVTQKTKVGVAHFRRTPSL